MSYKQVGALGLQSTAAKIQATLSTAQKALATARAAAPAPTVNVAVTAPFSEGDTRPWYKKPTNLLIGGGVLAALYFLIRK